MQRHHPLLFWFGAYFLLRHFLRSRHSSYFSSPRHSHRDTYYI